MSETVLDDTAVLEVFTDTACSDRSGRATHGDVSHTDSSLHIISYPQPNTKKPRLQKKHFGSLENQPCFVLIKTYTYDVYLLDRYTCVHN